MKSARPTVYLNRSIAHAIERYTTEGAPPGALGRILIEWALAVMDEVEPLDPEHARALLTIAPEIRLRPRTSTGEPRVSVELANLPNAILDEATLAGVSPEIARDLAERVAGMPAIQRLGLVLRLAWACEAMDLRPGPERRPLSFEEALRAARLVREP